MPEIVHPPRYSVCFKSGGNKDQGKISRTDIVVRNRFMEKPPQHIDFGTDICRSLTKGLSREWLVTNEIDEWASGTIAGRLSGLKKSLLKDNPAFIGKHTRITHLYQNPQQIRGIVELFQYRFCTQGPPQSVRDLIGIYYTSLAVVSLQLGPWQRSA